MSDKQSTLDKLNAFRKRDKFSTSAWEKRGLNPSDDDMCAKLQKLFNNCADNLIEATNSDFTSKQLKGIPDYCWTVIQCNNCDEFNLLSTGPNIKGYRQGNYKSIEQLPKTEYTEQEANTRLEQIKFFRGSSK